jgi:phosphoesterase RecJ-like protein
MGYHSLSQPSAGKLMNPMAFDEQQATSAYEALVKAKRILINAHQKPDGDTTGSSLALALWLQSLGKEVAVYCKHPAAEQFRYLSQASRFVNDPAIFSQPWDMLITCDSGDLAYAGIDEHVKLFPTKPVIINFDHHASNVMFGDFNIVDVAASSTAEVVTRFLRVNNVEIHRDMAMCLLTAIFTDTNGFTNAATTERALQYAAEFVGLGASLAHIHRATMVNKNVPMLQIWGKVFGRLQTSMHGIVYTYVHHHDLQGVHPEAVEGISNFLSQLQDARVIMVFYDRGDGTVKASMRTLHDDIDLSEFAKLFGGGGHKKASGFAVPGRLVEERGQVKIVPVQK